MQDRGKGLSSSSVLVACSSRVAMRVTSKKQRNERSVHAALKKERSTCIRDDFKEASLSRRQFAQPK